VRHWPADVVVLLVVVMVMLGGPVCLSKRQ
jgi:hypothetical protein